jgi:hypothetical protein
MSKIVVIIFLSQVVFSCKSVQDSVGLGEKKGDCEYYFERLEGLSEPDANGISQEIVVASKGEVGSVGYGYEKTASECHDYCDAGLDFKHNCEGHSTWRLRSVCKFKGGLTNSSTINCDSFAIH